jgi:methylenetetrahydrofolate dehydrogenase (NADP+) / methenyltetrahydrofolate cyclohydrolase / formyltetrahydrofolate synthetase
VSFSYYFLQRVAYKIDFRDIRDKLRNHVLDLQMKLPNFVPGLAIVQVGGREDSNVYIRMKIKAATDIGIRAEHVRLPKTITEGELLNEVRSEQPY